jgi:hypothetical protein
VIKSHFESRTQREKFLVLFMLAVGLLIWSSLFLDRFSSLMENRRTLNREISEQRLWLDQRDSIRANVQEGIQNLDPARTLSGMALSLEVERVSRNHGLRPSIETPRTEAADVFSYHTVTVALSNAEFAALINFTSELQRRAPYLGIEQVTVRPVQGNPMLLNANYRISSVELNP